LRPRARDVRRPSSRDARCARARPRAAPLHARPHGLPAAALGHRGRLARAEPGPRLARGAMIEVESLSVDFGETRAVDRISFEVAAGEAFGIVGESGSGKSTVLRALAGLNRSWSGRMTVEGVPQKPVRSREFYRRLQMV